MPLQSWLWLEYIVRPLTLISDSWWRRSSLSGSLTTASESRRHFLLSLYLFWTITWNTSTAVHNCNSLEKLSSTSSSRSLPTARRTAPSPHTLKQGLNWGIPPDLSSPTSALRSATYNLGSTTLKYRSGTFLLGSSIVKHGILIVWWIQCQCSTAGGDHLAVACAPGH